MKQGICRWLMVVGVLCGSASTPAIAARLGYSAGIEIRNPAQRVVQRLRLDAQRERSVQLYARVIAVTGTCVLGLWFVIGGIPKRNRGLTIVEPARSERLRMIDGPSFEASKNPVFLKAFPETTSNDNSWRELKETAIASDANDDDGDLMAHAARGFVQRWIVADDKNSSEAREKFIESAEMIAPIDHALLNEVEQYARQLLGRSPGLDVSSFDRMMEVAMGAVDAARCPVDKSELILCDEVATPVEERDVRHWVDQDETILCELLGITPEVADSFDEDVLGLTEMVRTPMRLSDAEMLDLEMENAGVSEAVTAAAPVHAASAEVGGGPLFDQRVIIMGESDAVLEIERRILIGAGARVITFRRWDEALRFADEKDFDLLLINGMTEDGWTVGKLYDWMSMNRPGWEKRSAFGLSVPDAEADDFAARTAAWCIVHPFGPKELVSFLQAVLAPKDEKLVS